MQLGHECPINIRYTMVLTDAIASGTLRASAALTERLARAEAELARLRAAPPTPRPLNVERLLPQVVERYRDLVAVLRMPWPRQTWTWRAQNCGRCSGLSGRSPMDGKCASKLTCVELRRRCYAPSERQQILW